MKPHYMLRFAILFLLLTIMHNAYASERYEYSEDDMEEYVPVKVYLSESSAKAKRYGDLKFVGYEWGLILIGALLFSIGWWNINDKEETLEEKQQKLIFGVLARRGPKPDDHIEKRKKRKEMFYWCIMLIGFACLYPCLFGLYYHFRQGLVHIIGLALLLIPFAIVFFKK